ncbi:DNA repair protein RAD51 homolog 3 isoform X2 [Beta vulgaris subsp. vulgaris]|uniref:DNA repair protein RAD51 homolog 3 isoform X2 n=1 Tax=Beta vulgaris subsp. vulgaris TaxID=3555 RepID=UPI0020368CBE|nr:DNA repair protein RAD51 homolog 3 isoform X2 [Beta vulgaris subsp. vulgaris]
MEVMRIAISGTQRGKLISAGYTSLSSLSSISPSLLARDLNISEVEALEILKAASHSSRKDNAGGSHAVLNGAQNAWEMLHGDSCTRITTSSADVDDILGGGISCKEVTEIGGVPGIGKTQFGIQLAINVQIPVDFGGLGGKAIYVDTEGSFIVERALQIAEGCIDVMGEDDYFRQRDIRAVREKLLPEVFLANIFYFRICSYTELIAMINHLDEWVSKHKDVKVVVIDSLTFYFRQDFEDMALRTRILGEMALKLMKLAHKFNLAVVILNQAATKYTEGSCQLTLALGDSWSHASTNRIILYWKGDERCAYVDKSPSLPSASAPYSITAKGIRNSSKNCKRLKIL